MYHPAILDQSFSNIPANLAPVGSPTSFLPSVGKTLLFIFCYREREGRANCLYEPDSKSVWKASDKEKWPAASLGKGPLGQGKEKAKLPAWARYEIQTIPVGLRHKQKEEIAETGKNKESKACFQEAENIALWYLFVIHSPNYGQ